MNWICFVNDFDLNRFRKLIVDLFCSVLSFRDLWVVLGVLFSSLQPESDCHSSFKPARMTAQRSLTLSQAALVFMSKNRGTLNSFLFDRLNLAARLNEMPHKFNYSLPRAVNHRRTGDAHWNILDIQNISWASAYGNLIASSGTNWDSLYPDHTGMKWKSRAAKLNICQRPPIRPLRQLWV